MKEEGEDGEGDQFSSKLILYVLVPKDCEYTASADTLTPSAGNSRLCCSPCAGFLINIEAC